MERATFIPAATVLEKAGDVYPYAPVSPLTFNLKLEQAQKKAKKEAAPRRSCILTMLLCLWYVVRAVVSTVLLGVIAGVVAHHVRLGDDNLSLIWRSVSDGVFVEYELLSLAAFFQ